MKPILHIIILAFLVACNSTVKAPEKKNKSSRKTTTAFVYTERLVTGSDTEVLNIRDLGTGDLDLVLSQRWVLTDVSDVSHDHLAFKNGNEERLFPEIILFSDFRAMLEPRGDMQIGAWKRKLEDKIHTIYFTYGNSKTKTYRIRELAPTKLKVSWKDGNDSFWITLHSDGKMHQNLMNDPFYPPNNWWRIKPAKKESDLEVFKRVQACVRFFALYYRDVIKRKSKEITWAGLPEIFEWYNSAIGLPDRKLVENSWINCFYNKEQALQGYDILHKLIVDYEYNWPEGTPSWEYRTHSVLEQMYFTMDSLQKVKPSLKVQDL